MTYGSTDRQDPRGLFVRLRRFGGRYGVSLNGGPVGGVGVQLLQIRGVELDPRPAGANDDAAVVLFRCEQSCP
jgi:hypothetical protein